MWKLCRHKTTFGPSHTSEYTQACAGLRLLLFCSLNCGMVLEIFCMQNVFFHRLSGIKRLRRQGSQSKSQIVRTAENIKPKQEHAYKQIMPRGRRDTPTPSQFPLVALEPGTACHLELGGGFVRGVLKPSGTCLNRVADHLAWHTVYQ